MPWWTWLCVAIGGAAILLAGAVAAVAVARLLGALRATRGRIETLAASVSESASLLETRSATVSLDQERAQASVGRLRASVAQLQVLVAALEEIRIGIRIARLLAGR